MSEYKRHSTDSGQYGQDDSPDAVNTVIRQLTVPQDHVATTVSKLYNNDMAQGNEVKAYAKIAGRDWTFYVKELKVSIGRNAESHSTQEDGVDIDLGPSKVVSRNHAVIKYNLQTRCWELFITGRNGLKVNGERINIARNVPTELNSGNIIDIGGTQMMFILPDAAPVIPEFFRGLLQNKKLKQENHSSAKEIVLTDQVRAFQLREGISITENGNGQSNDKDLSKDECKGIKPPYSYATMITQAILSNPQGILSLSEIYDWIASHYAYYRHTKQGWQNSIRHNLSLNKAFEKVPRKPNEPGKGMKWQISGEYRRDFMNKWRDGSLSKMKRGTSVSRQLQLHLIKNNALPQGRNSSQPLPLPKPEPMNDLKNQGQQQGQQQQQQQQQGQQQRTGSLNHFQQNPYAPQNNVQQNQFIPTLQKFNNDAPQLAHPSQQHLLAQQQTLPLAITKQPQQPIQNVNKDFTVPIIKEPKLASPLKSLNNVAAGDHLNNSHKRSDSLGLNSNLLGMGQLTMNQLNQDNGSSMPAKNSKLQKFNSVNNNNSHSPNKINASISNTNDLISPGKIATLPELMTPERGMRHLEPHSAGRGVSTNSSPALWNYVQFSTPLGADKLNNKPNIQNDKSNEGETIDIPKVDIESPLKNRRTIQITGLKDLKDV